MPVPLIIIGGAAAVSIGSTVHSTWKSRKWKKIHAEALENFKATEARTRPVANSFNAQAEGFGKFRVSSKKHLERAAEFLSVERGQTGGKRQPAGSHPGGNRVPEDP